MNITSYPMSPDKVIFTSALNLTKAEEKLILRLRQTKRRGERRQFLIDPLRMTLIPVEAEEIEELSRP